MRTLKTKINDKSYVIKFNLMDCDDMETKFSLAEEGAFGIFSIADSMLEAEYTNQFS